MADKKKNNTALAASVAEGRKRIAGSILDKALPAKEDLDGGIQVLPEEGPRYTPSAGMFPGFATIPESTDVPGVVNALTRSRGMPVTYTQHDSGVGMRPFSASDDTLDPGFNRERTINAMKSWGAQNPEQLYDKTMLNNAAMGHNRTATGAVDPSYVSPVDAATGAHRWARDMRDHVVNMVLSPEQILKNRMEETKKQIKDLSKPLKKGG